MWFVLSVAARHSSSPTSGTLQDLKKIHSGRRDMPGGKWAYDDEDDPNSEWEDVVPGSEDNDVLKSAPPQTEDELHALIDEAERRRQSEDSDDELYRGTPERRQSLQPGQQVVQQDAYMNQVAERLAEIRKQQDLQTKLQGEDAADLTWTLFARITKYRFCMSTLARR